MTVSGDVIRSNVLLENLSIRYLDGDGIFLITSLDR